MLVWGSLRFTLTIYYLHNICCSYISSAVVLPRYLGYIVIAYLRVVSGMCKMSPPREKCFSYISPAVVLPRYLGYIIDFLSGGTYFPASIMYGLKPYSLTVTTSRWSSEGFFFFGGGVKVRLAKRAHAVMWVVNNQHLPHHRILNIKACLWP